MEPKEKNKSVFRTWFDVAKENSLPEYDIRETEEFLNEFLPSDNPTSEEYLEAYQAIQRLRETRNEQDFQSYRDLGVKIEAGLPYTKKGFQLIYNQIYYEVTHNIDFTKSLVHNYVFLDFDNWTSGYAGQTLWRMLNRSNVLKDEKYANNPQYINEKLATDTVINRLLINASEISEQAESELNDEIQRRKDTYPTVEKAIDTTKKVILKPIPKFVKKGASWIRDKAIDGSITDFEDLENTTTSLRHSKIYFESMKKILNQPYELFYDFSKKYDFWMSSEGEIILSNLLLFREGNYVNIYYRLLKEITEEAKKRGNIEAVGRIGTRHVLRKNGLDPLSVDFTDIEYWRGITPPKKDKDNRKKLPKKYPNKQDNGFTLLKTLLKSNNSLEEKIYCNTMEAFISYVEQQKDKVKDFEITINFFKTQYGLDRVFNISEGDRVQPTQDTAFSYILKSYLWLKYGPEYTEEKATNSDIALYKIQKEVLLKGIGVWKDLWNIFNKKGFSTYQVAKDSYLDIERRLKEKYTQAGWDLITFSVENYPVIKDMYKDIFKKYDISFEENDDRFFYLAILFGTLEYALAMKAIGNLKEVGKSANTYLHGQKVLTPLEEINKQAEEQLKRWRFKADEEGITLDNHIRTSLQNLSIFWGRGYGVKVNIIPEGIEVENPLHTQGDQRKVTKDGREVKTRQNGGGRDHVIIPWEIIARSSPEINYAPYVDLVLKLVAKVKANTSLTGVTNPILNFVEKGPGVISFAPEGSDRIYELPPVLNADELAKELKTIAKLMVESIGTEPKDILKRIQ